MKRVYTYHGLEIQARVETEAVSARSVAPGYGTGYVAIVKNTRAGLPASSFTPGNREWPMGDQDSIPACRRSSIVVRRV
ncbi:hypothetical protein CUJ88_47090 (plasmid) [Paraburkholderia hospita]|nr:hypothetical protein CUJ88_47090 [Paraburkholderia hospita]